MKINFILLLLLLFIIYFFSSCNSNKFSIGEDISAIYLTVTPFGVSPISINEINIHFTDESTCSQLRIHGEDIDLISDRLKYLRSTEQTELPKKYGKYIKIWVGLQLANERKRLNIGITRDGLIKIGSRFYEKDDSLFTVIFRQKIHPRILETIPRDSIWGKFLTNK